MKTIADYTRKRDHAYPNVRSCPCLRRRQFTWNCKGTTPGSHVKLTENSNDANYSLISQTVLENLSCDLSCVFSWVRVRGQRTDTDWYSGSTETGYIWRLLARAWIANSSLNMSEQRFLILRDFDILSSQLATFLPPSISQYRGGLIIMKLWFIERNESQVNTIWSAAVSVDWLSSRFSGHDCQTGNCDSRVCERRCEPWTSSDRP